ncbi:unnamed protein product [Scytosiphon promiscuus]
MLAEREAVQRSIAAEPARTQTASGADPPALPTGPACDLETPATYAQACSGPFSSLWEEAREKEMKGLVAVGTFAEDGGG